MPAGKLYRIPRKAKVVPTKKEVKGMIKRAVREANPLKHNDEYSTGSEITTTATITNLTDGITQSDTATSRTGDQVSLKWGRFSASAVRKANTGATYDFDALRIILVKWFPDSANETPTEANILFNSAADDMNAPTELDVAESSKFRVLYDSRVLLGNRQSSNPVNANLPIVKDLRIKYYGSKQLGKIHFNTGAVTGKGHIYLVAIGSQTTGVNASTLRYHFSVKYDD